MDRLTAERDVIALDLPGFGELARRSTAAARPRPRRSPPPWPSSCPDGPHHVAGNSLGGWVALELAAAGHARSVTAIAPAGLWPEPLAPKRGIARGAGEGHPARPARARAQPGGPPARARVDGRRTPSASRPRPRCGSCSAYADAPGFEAVNRAMRAGRFTRLEHIRVPVTLAWPEHDRLVARPAHLPPTVRNVALPGAGHVPMWDAPEAGRGRAAARAAVRPPEARPELPHHPGVVADAPVLGDAAVGDADHVHLLGLEAAAGGLDPEAVARCGCRGCACGWRRGRRPRRCGSARTRRPRTCSSATRAGRSPGRCRARCRAGWCG